MKFSRLCSLFAVGASLAAGGTSAGPSLAVKDFVRHESYSAVRISPTGEYLAMTVDRGEQDVLVVLKTSDLSVLKLNRLPNEKSVGEFQWTSPNRLIFNAVKKFGSYAQPFGTGEWFAVNADGSQPRPLIFGGTRDATQRGKTVAYGTRYDLLDTLRDDDEHVLMTMSYRRSKDGAGTELVELDTLSGRHKSLGRAPRENCGVAVDSKKELRFAICFDTEDASGKYDTWTELYRRDDDGKWTLLNRAQDTGYDLSFAGTAGDGRIYATHSDRKGTDAFGVLNTDNGTFEPLFHDPISDPSGFIRAADGETVIGVVTMAGRPEVTFVDQDHPDVAIYAGLAQAFPEQFVDFSSATRDGNSIVVSVYSDRNPGELYLYNRATGKARFLMQRRGWIDPEAMASVEPFEFTSRDGLKLHGYLTIPHGSDGKNLPLILNPHGGPMGPRDDWGYNGEAQLFASRGYAVMQVNYRGSGGFGKEFLDRAYGQWAQGIMNDLVDAVQWAVAEGRVDKERVCIFGGSFGGYAALMAPARAPDLFKCAFGYVGLYDAKIQLELSDTSRSAAGLRYLERAFGSTRKEQNAMSPISYADQIRLPVYLAAGARDPRCPPEHSEAMYEALKKAGNTPEGLIVQSGEMHGFYGEEARVKLYNEMLAFFDRHIGTGNKTPAATAATGSQ